MPLTNTESEERMDRIIRAYRPTDHDRLMAITDTCFEDVSIDAHIEKRHGPIAGRDWRWRKRRDIEGDIRRDAAGVLVADQDGEVIGYITTASDSESGIGRIPNMAVMPGHQRKGMGRALLEAGLRHLKARGMQVARIETLAHNLAGQHLYPSLGFEEVARQIHYAMPLDGGREAYPPVKP